MIKKIKHKLEKDSNLKEMLSGSALTFFLKMSGMFMSYLLIFIISKKIGAAGVGFYSIMIQILTVLGTILCLGMNDSVLRYVGQFNNDNNQTKIHILYRIVINTVGPLTICIGAFIYFGADFIANYIGKDAEYATGLKCIGFVLPFFTINKISVEFIRGLKKLMISEFIRSVLRPIVLILGIVFFFYNDLTKLDVIYLLVIALIMNSVFSGLAIWKELKKIENEEAIFERKELMKTSLPMMTANISNIFIVAMPIFFLDYFSTQASVGIYSIALKIASLISVILIVVNTIAGPKFAELFWSRKKSELQKLIKQVTKLIFWIAFIICIILIAGAKFWLGFFGDEFTSGNIALVLLIIGQFVNAASGSVVLLMNMSGNQVRLRNALIIIMPFAFISYAVFVPMFDIIGAALVTMGITIILNFYLAVYIYRKLNLKMIYIPFLSK